MTSCRLSLRSRLRVSYRLRLVAFRSDRGISELTLGLLLPRYSAPSSARGQLRIRGCSRHHPSLFPGIDCRSRSQRRLAHGQNRHIETAEVASESAPESGLSRGLSIGFANGPLRIFSVEPLTTNALNLLFPPGDQQRQLFPGKVLGEKLHSCCASAACPDCTQSRPCIDLRNCRLCRGTLAESSLMRGTNFFREKFLHMLAARAAQLALVSVARLSGFPTADFFREKFCAAALQVTTCIGSRSG